MLGDGRTIEVLAGRVRGEDLLAVRGSRVLVANRMPTDDGGTVVTLRDRTEPERLDRELDATPGLIDALRAQDHEHANRMHTLLGLLELEPHEEAVEFVTVAVGVHRATAEQITGLAGRQGASAGGDGWRRAAPSSRSYSRRRRPGGSARRPGPDGPLPPGPGTGSGTTGSGTAGSGTAGSGTAGSGMTAGTSQGRATAGENR